MILKPNQIYKHFKGNLYRIITIAKHSETEEEMVVYQALYGEYAVYTRPLVDFIQILDKAKYPYATQNYRFELVKELVEPVPSTGREMEAEPVSLNERKMEAETMHLAGKEKKAEPVEEETKKEQESSKGKEASIDPMLEAYLDTDSYRERLNILHGLQHRITEHMLLTMAVVIDFELPEGSIQEKYDALHDCLLTRERYECNRMV